MKKVLFILLMAVMLSTSCENNLTYPDTASEVYTYTESDSVYDYINDYIRNTIKRNEGILKELEDFAMENHVPIVHPEVAKLLQVLGMVKKPARILEIGTAIGYSSIERRMTMAPLSYGSPTAARPVRRSS
jgi:hypothetical protein